MTKARATTKRISPHRARLDRDGYVVVDGLFSSNEILALGAELDRITCDVSVLPHELQEQLTFERELSQAQRGEITAEMAGDHVFIIGELQRFAPAFERLIEHGGILESLESIFDSHEFAFHYMNATIKSARIGSKVSWHRDWPNQYMCGKNSKQVRLILCIDGMRDGAGAINIVRNTHVISDKDARSATTRGAVWRAEDIDTIECAPGAVVVLHSKLVHGSGPNRSERVRRNIISQWGGPGNALVGKAREPHTGRRPLID